MGFAENWTRIADAPHHPTLKDKLDTMDTIQGQTSPRGNSVHTVHIVPRGTGQAGPEASNKSVHTVHIVHKDSIREDLSMGASAPSSGLEWVTCPPEFDAEKYGDLWAAFDLADVCKLYGVRVVRAGERILAVYPPALEPELIAYAGSLLAEAREYLASHLDKLPILPPAEAVTAIKEIMRQHKGLRFTKGDDGSRWPIYPRTWTAGQKATAQSLWFAAGEALDRDDFMEVDR